MDRGAHFYKCDLQVHTPRDINWQGNSAVTDEERRAYATEFVAACRSKGLQAVAQFRNIPASFEMRASVPQYELLQQAHTTLRTWSAEVQRIVADLLSAFEEPVREKPLAPYFSGLEEWKRLSQAHAAQYDLAKTRATAHEDTLRQIQALEARITDLNESADANGVLQQSVMSASLSKKSVTI